MAFKKHMMYKGSKSVMAKTKKEKSALKEKARGYKYISPKTLRKLKRLS